MDKKYIEVEYDKEYYGGDYNGVGDFILVPYKKNIEREFEKLTGLNRKHIIHYSCDELYNKDGELI